MRLTVPNLVEDDGVTWMHVHDVREVGDEALVRLRVMAVDVDGEGLRRVLRAAAADARE
jgi:hypothetical protein